MSAESVAQIVAAKASFKELAAARALGYDAIDALVSSWRTLDAVYALAHSEHRPAVWPRGSGPVGSAKC